MSDANPQGGLILLYHRVTEPQTDPQLLAVTPARFAAQLDVLKELARPVTLGEMVAAAREGEDVRGTVAVTFDDGYADNLLEARPILKRAGVPATVFVATGGTGAAGEFFWDELDRIFLQPGRLPARLRVGIGAAPYEADLGTATDYSADQAAQLRGWNVTLAENPTPRQRIYRDLCGLIHKAPTAQRREALRQIQEWSGMGRRARASHRMMTATEIRELTEDGLIDVGGHTVSHPLLAVESPQDQRREIAAGKQALESTLGRAVRSFSYPFGGRRDYTGVSVAAVKDAGFAYACSNFNGMVTRDTDCFQLPRVLVRDWPADEFRSRLERWLAGRFKA